MPPQSDDDLAAWYHAADVFCLPSVARSEAFGLVQIEAHAAGTPTVSTDLTTGVPFANLDGVTGLTVPVGDVEALAAALGTILGDDELRQRLGAAGARAGAHGVHDRAHGGRHASRVRRGEGSTRVKRSRFIALVRAAGCRTDQRRHRRLVLPAFRRTASRLQLRALRGSRAGDHRRLPRATGYVYGLYEPERTENPWAVVRAVISSVTLGHRAHDRAAVLRRPRVLLVLPSRHRDQLGRARTRLLAGWRLLFLRSRRSPGPSSGFSSSARSVAHELAEEMKRRARWGYRVVGLVAGRVRMPERRRMDPSVLGTLDDLTHARCASTTSIASSSSLPWRCASSSSVSRSPMRRGSASTSCPSSTRSSSARSTRWWPTSRSWRSRASTVPPWFVTSKRASTSSARSSCSMLLSPVLLLAGLGSAGLHGLARVLRAGARRQGHEAVPPPQVPHDGARCREARLARCLPRLTTTGSRGSGRFLRTYRIDELPQLVNILKGEMSFVGPRPERPFFVEQFVREIPGYRERFRIAPGVTGLPR